MARKKRSPTGGVCVRDFTESSEWRLESPIPRGLIKGCYGPTWPAGRHDKLELVIAGKLLKSGRNDPSRIELVCPKVLACPADGSAAPVEAASSGAPVEPLASRKEVSRAMTAGVSRKAMLLILLASCRVMDHDLGGILGVLFSIGSRI
jgi:hypothetical protein